VEYLSALWRMAWIVARLPGPVAVVQSANPPDVLFLVGLVAKLRWRSRLLFDHHDLVPELFQTRFGASSPVLPVVRAAERLNFRLADAVISTNESYRNIAIERGGMAPERVRVVRNARNRSTFQRVEPNPELRRGRPHLAVYVGMMGPQDGADIAVRVAAHYRHQLGRDDLTVTLVGDGDEVPNCRRLAAELEVDDMVHFAGWCTRDEVLGYLSTADVGLATDPPSPLNDRSTMIKVIEYVTVGLPVVSFDLPESRVTAGEAALYSPGGDVASMTENLARLIDDPGLHAKLSSVGLEQTEGPLSWETMVDSLLASYQDLTQR
jgi:glycosyltransferase involved in cell wall biosynthesis